MRPMATLIDDAHQRVLDHYGTAIGRSKYELVTPALVIDREILLANLTYLEGRLPELHARLRGHVKNHKSPHVARLQLEHGAFGLTAATVWGQSALPNRVATERARSLSSRPTCPTPICW